MIFKKESNHTQLSYLNLILKIWDSIWHSTTCWERVFRFIFCHFHYFVNVQVVVQPSGWTHHCHTSFSGIPCKLLLPGSGGPFTKLDLGPVLCPPSPETPSLPWNSFRISLIPLISWLQTAPCLLQKRKGANFNCHCSIHKYTSAARTE